MARIVIVEKEKCNPEGCGGGLCARVSPSNRAGKEAFYMASDGKIAVNETLVSDIDQIACNKCPFGALKMINLPSALTEEPVHRYSKNGFVLYRLPIPIFGKVVGILGRNGIGKSTAIKILAGVLQPNLGRVEEQTQGVLQFSNVTVKDLITHFKGNEAQGYFEKLRDKKIKLAYKPQQVEQIPKAFKGTVKDLLTKVNERGEDALAHVAATLRLAHLFERDIAVISGGELQRVAIAAAVLKDANVLFFDEPTSYLDITQRLAMAKFIQQLATPETAAVVVDHDLIILDYMTELVHILYGQENGYGVVSQPKATKTGMNVYLDGYLKEENVRFRQHKIQFSLHAANEKRRDDLLAEWPRIEERHGSFTLVAQGGAIMKHDVIGIVGENGIGKTTFVRALAKLQGTTSRGALRISVKPQYLEESDGFDAQLTVGEFLLEAQQYEHQLMVPLDLRTLFLKKMGELSGGQLQRVVIARCLAADADLFLLDEPSAYLDVEQRLLMSKVIREMMEAKGKACLVVDHDLLFIDNLSEKLIVFDGEPGMRGEAHGPFPMHEGMNRFLRELHITFRRDDVSNRPRVNKDGSVLDREQKASGKLYYMS